MILLLSGTKDGRVIAEKLEKAGYDVIASSVTQYGEYLLKESFDGEVLSKPMDESDMNEIIKKRGIKLVIDATHPYAVNASKNALNACEKAGIQYIRYERDSFEGIKYPKAVYAEDISGAAMEAKKIDGNIFLTTGSKNLQDFVGVLGPERLIARVLPVSSVIEKCEELGLMPKNIVAMQGPFSVDLNRDMFRHFNARAVVTKDSGKIGGIYEKVEAAKQLDIPIIIIKRPSLVYGCVVSDVEQLMREVVRIGRDDSR